MKQGELGLTVCNRMVDYILNPTALGGREKVRTSALYSGGATSRIPPPVRPEAGGPTHALVQIMGIDESGEEPNRLRRWVSFETQDRIRFRWTQHNVPSTAMTELITSRFGHKDRYAFPQAVPDW